MKMPCPHCCPAQEGLGNAPGKDAADCCTQCAGGKHPGCKFFTLSMGVRLPPLPLTLFLTVCCLLQQPEWEVALKHKQASTTACQEPLARWLGVWMGMDGRGQRVGGPPSASMRAVRMRSGRTETRARGGVRGVGLCLLCTYRAGGRKRGCPPRPA